jgi:hypothetical protein
VWVIFPSIAIYSAYCILRDGNLSIFSPSSWGDREREGTREHWRRFLILVKSPSSMRSNK